MSAAPVRVMGVVGWKDSGKTTLVARLVRAFTTAGLRVSTIKHAHHAVDLDVPGTDSFRHRAAGAHEVLLATAHRFALMRELRGAAEPDLGALLGRLGPADLVLVEGFKSHRHAKIEVHRAVLGTPLLAADDPSIIAVATDLPALPLDRPRLDLDDVAGIAAFVLAHAAALP